MQQWGLFYVVQCVFDQLICLLGSTIVFNCHLLKSSVQMWKISIEVCQVCFIAGEFDIRLQIKFRAQFSNQFKCVYIHGLIEHSNNKLMQWTHFSIDEIQTVQKCVPQWQNELRYKLLTNWTELKPKTGDSNCLPSESRERERKRIRYILSRNHFNWNRYHQIWMRIVSNSV